MDANQSRRDKSSAEPARPGPTRSEQARSEQARHSDSTNQVEAARRRVRRPNDGPVEGFDGHTDADEARSVVMHLAQRVDELTGELDRAKRRVLELETMTDEDPLLPVLNRRGFVRELGRVIAFMGRYETPASLAYVDVDDLKAINDSYGHAAGDAVLVAISDLLRRQVRASDIVGRLGGDEFGVILWTAAEADAVRKAESIATGIAAETVNAAGLRLPVSISVGVSALAASDSVESALARADAAMCRAKRSG